MKYYLRMVRPRFETRLIEVDATSYEHAKLLGTMAGMVPSDDWQMIDHDPYTYAAHVERCSDEHNFEANGQTVEEGVADLASTAVPEDDKYLLMYADTFTGEGRIVPEPWLLQHGTLMITDLCCDWGRDVEGLAADTSFNDGDGDTPERSNLATAKILLFRKAPAGDVEPTPPTG